MKTIALLAFTAVAGWAVPIACPTATASTIDSSGIAYINVDNIQTPGNAANALNSISPAVTVADANGCVTTDQTFYGFRVSETGSGWDNADPSTAGTYLYASGNRIMFSSVRDCGAACSDDTTNNFVVDSSGGAVSFVFRLQDVTLQNGVSSVVFYLTNWGVTGGGTFTIDLFGCANPTTTTTSGFTDCSVVGGAPMTTLTYNFPTNATSGAYNPSTIPVAVSSQALAGLVGSVNDAYFTLRVTLDAGGNNIDGPGADVANRTYFFGVGLEFLETPEPSTFGLLGSALLGLGYLARRRQRA